MSFWGQSLGQGWTELGYLGVALLLSALIGLEREVRQKSAGLRTHTLVGVASALIMLVSKYGFFDVLSEHVTLDPSRVAAQIVSGIGFIGGGLIFVRRDIVRGLTTAAVVWLTCAVGMAAGAGLPLLAVTVTAAHFLVVFGLSPLARRLPTSPYTPSPLRLHYLDGQGVLRRALAECTGRGFTVVELGTAHAFEPEEADQAARRRIVELDLELQGKGSMTELATALTEMNGVISVHIGDRDRAGE
ncbi:MgtC/SapB family protein [Flindersiella endophytica]